MAIAIVQSKQPTVTTGNGGLGTGAFNGVASSLAFNSATTTGNTIVIVVGIYYGNGPATGPAFAPTDNYGNTYTRAARGSRSGGTNDCTEVWYCTNATGGAGHTISYAGSGTNYGEYALFELSGVDNASPVDYVLTGGDTGAATPNAVTFGTGFSNGSPNTLTLPTTSAPAAGGEFWVVAAAPGGGPGFAGGASITGSAALANFGYYSDYATSNNACWAADILASSAAQSFTISTPNAGTDSVGFCIVAFKVAASGGGKNLTTMFCG